MNTLVELKSNELSITNGGGCSFAYDAGFAIRLLGHMGMGAAGVGYLVSDLIIYNYHCN